MKLFRLDKPKPCKDTLFAFSVLIKGLILLASFLFIYHYIFVKNDVNEFLSLTGKSLTSLYNMTCLILVFFLMFINWLLEAIKWRLLILGVCRHSMTESIRAVLAGTALGLFTPNRIGELGGRLLFLKSEDRISGVIMAGLGSLSQLLFTVLFGSVGLFFLSMKGFLLPGKSESLVYSLAGIVLAGLILFLFQKPLRSLLEKKFKKDYGAALTNFNMFEIGRILMLSCMRYAVFFVQFYLLLHVFGVQVSFFNAAFLIPATLLAISVIPSFALADIGVRGVVSVFFIGLVSSNSAGIIAASVALWIINIAFPALLGNLVLINHSNNKKAKE